MKRTLGLAFATIAAMSAGHVAAQEAGDPAAGEKVFLRCKACHVVEEPTNRVGPYLTGVVGRTPGTVESFNYSDAMKAFGEDHVWDEETLTTYLADPRNVVEGTKMAFAGLKKPEDIANVIAYLKQFDPPS